MQQNSPVHIEYFSDVLCVWAYGGQIRMDQLQKDFGAQLAVHYRFCPLFAAAQRRVDEQWGTRGGYTGFNHHLRELSAGWSHVHLHPGVWLQAQPTSSTGVHALLKAVEILARAGEWGASGANAGGRSRYEEFIWQMRTAFFRDALDISRRDVQQQVLTALDIPPAAAFALVDNGAAFAALHEDARQYERYAVPGSPTLVFNQGRQTLYGNVGYRIVEANLRELLRDPQFGEASWC